MLVIYNKTKKYVIKHIPSSEELWKTKGDEEVVLYIKKEGEQYHIYDNNSIGDNKYDYECETNNENIYYLKCNCIINSLISNQEMNERIVENVKSWERENKLIQELNHTK